MIVVTRLNGQAFAVNPDLIERADCTPDTVVTLVDGTKYIVSEPVEEIIRRIRDFRASVVATAHLLEAEAERGRAPGARPPHLSPVGGETVVPLHPVPRAER